MADKNVRNVNDIPKDEVPSKKEVEKDLGLDKKPTKDWTTSEAGKIGGEVGGHKVARLVEEGKGKEKGNQSKERR